MFRKHLVACILLVALFHYIDAMTDEEDQEQEKKFSQCDRDIAQVMCKNLIDDILECAEKMPSDERPLWYECAEELGISDEKELKPILNSICSNGNKSVEVAWDLSECWSDKMDERRHEMNDTVYPEDYFICCEENMDKAVDGTECYCQGEKRPRQQCKSAPKTDGAQI